MSAREDVARLLIIDDDAAVGDVLSIVLTGRGHTVETFTSAEEGLTRLADPKKPTIDAAIVDVWLKGEDGLEVADRLARRERPIPFMIISGGGPGRSLEVVTARADALGAHTVLFKPFENDELLEAVAKMLAAGSEPR